MTARRKQSVVAGISLVYDLVLGLALLLAADRFASLFGVMVPEPRIFVTLCGLFLIGIAAGYTQPIKAPDQHRAYLWIFGPGLKWAGALAFVWAHLVNGAPASFMLFAFTDGALGLATLWALVSGDDRVRA